MGASLLRHRTLRLTPIQLPPTLQWLLPDGVLALYDLLGEAEPAISGMVHFHHHLYTL